MYRKLFWINNVAFDSTGQLLTMNYALVQYLRKDGNATNQYIELLIHFKKVYDSVRRRVGGGGIVLYTH